MYIFIRRHICIFFQRQMFYSQELTGWESFSNQNPPVFITKHLTPILTKRKGRSEICRKGLRWKIKSAQSISGHEGLFLCGLHWHGCLLLSSPQREDQPSTDRRACEWACWAQCSWFLSPQGELWAATENDRKKGRQEHAGCFRGTGRNRRNRVVLGGIPSACRREWEQCCWGSRTQAKVIWS